MNKVKKLYLKNKIKLRRWLVRSAVIGTSLGGSMTLLSSDTPITIQNEKKAPLINYSMIEAFKYGLCNSIGDYIDKTSFAVDTVIINKKALDHGTASFSDGNDNLNATTGKKNMPRHTLAIYRFQNGKKEVALKYFVPDTLSETNLTSKDKQRILKFVANNNKKHIQRGLLAHEFIHQSRCPDGMAALKLKVKVSKENLFNFKTTAYQDAKLCFHNEIGANIGTLLYQREEYLKTGDLSVFTGYNRKYAKEIESGRINPRSVDGDAKYAERLFIFKSISEQWMKNDKEYYSNYAITQTDLLDNAGKYIKNKGADHNKEYIKALDLAYTFIMDGELVNLNFISANKVKDIEMTKTVKNHLKEKAAPKETALDKQINNLLRNKQNF